MTEGGVRQVTLELCRSATIESFDKESYEFINQDVVMAAHGDPGFSRQHFATFGLNEGRRQIDKSILSAVEELRERKLQQLALKVPHHETDLFGTVMKMAIAPDPQLPVPFERVSSHEYDAEIADLFDGNPDKLFLDLGAGLRPTYRGNVVYTEIAVLPSTDVIAFADCLPFETGTFDGACCLAVLEHVPEPWKAAAELLRVVKPGGRVIVDWPFLQPVHGYPHHYFNATQEGARELFEGLGAEVESYVPPWHHPIFSLHWILGEWQKGLAPPEQQELLGLTVREILQRDPASHLGLSRWVSELSDATRPVISAGTRLRMTNSR
jgi:SAM-dependent methyltransferase